MCKMWNVECEMWKCDNVNMWNVKIWKCDNVTCENVKNFNVKIWKCENVKWECKCLKYEYVNAQNVKM